MENKNILLNIEPLIEVINQNNFKNATKEQKECLNALVNVVRFLKLEDILEVEKKLNKEVVSYYFKYLSIDTIDQVKRNKKLDLNLAKIIFGLNKSSFFNTDRFNYFDFCYANQDIPQDIVKNQKILDKINLIKETQNIIKQGNPNLFTKDFIKKINQHKDFKKFLINICASNIDSELSKKLLEISNIKPSNILTHFSTLQNYSSNEVIDFFDSSFFNNNLNKLKNNLEAKSQSLYKLQREQAFKYLKTIGNKNNLNYSSLTKLETFHMLKGNSGELIALIDLISIVKDKKEQQLIFKILDFFKDDILNSYNAKEQDIKSFLINNYKNLKLTKSTFSEFNKLTIIWEKESLENNLNTNFNQFKTTKNQYKI